MKRKLKKEGLPVKQSHLAAYIGVTASHMCMTDPGNNHYRTLPSSASLKLTKLEYDFYVTAKQQKSPGTSYLEHVKSDEKECREIHDKMLWEIKQHEYKSKILQEKLNKMILSFNKDKQWLNLVDARLASLPENVKKASIDYTWFPLQRVITLARMQKSGNAAQLKLIREIEMSKAICSVNIALRKKLKRMAG